MPKSAPKTAAKPAPAKSPAEANAKPPAKNSRNFNDPAFQSAMSADAIAKVTAEGKGKMPAYRSTLKPAEIDAIAAHVKTLAP